MQSPELEFSFGQSGRGTDQRAPCIRSARIDVKENARWTLWRSSGYSSFRSSPPPESTQEGHTRTKKLGVQASKALAEMRLGA